MAQVNVDPGYDGGGEGGVSAVAILAIVILVLLAVFAVYYLFAGSDGDADTDINVDTGSPTSHVRTVAW
jgi:hypothetical protein